MSAADLAELGLALPVAAASSTVADVDMSAEEAAVKAEEAAPTSSAASSSSDVSASERASMPYPTLPYLSVFASLPPPLVIRVFRADQSFESFDACTRLGVIMRRMAGEEGVQGLLGRPPFEGIYYIQDAHIPVPPGDFDAIPARRANPPSSPSTLDWLMSSVSSAVQSLNPEEPAAPAAATPTSAVKVERTEPSDSVDPSSDVRDSASLPEVPPLLASAALSLPPRPSLIRVFREDGSFETFDARTRLSVITGRMKREHVWGVVGRPPARPVHYLMSFHIVPAGDFDVVKRERDIGRPPSPPSTLDWLVSSVSSAVQCLQRPTPVPTPLPSRSSPSRSRSSAPSLLVPSASTPPPAPLVIRVFRPDGSYESFDAGIRLSVITQQMKREHVWGVIRRPPYSPIRYLESYHIVPAGDFDVVKRKKDIGRPPSPPSILERLMSSMSSSSQPTSAPAAALARENVVKQTTPSDTETEMQPLIQRSPRATAGLIHRTPISTVESKSAL